MTAILNRLVRIMRAVEIDPSLGDYSLYQEAFVRGLQRDYNGKVQTLNRLISDYPESQYMDDALYEQGRAFVQMEDNANAIARFNILVKNFRRAMSHGGRLTRSVCYTIRMTSILKPSRLIAGHSRLSGQ
mgnify:CR=1 FL=1